MIRVVFMGEPLVRAIGGVAAGIVAAFVVVLALEMVGLQIFQPLGEKRRYIHIECRGSAKCLRISGPAEAFVPLRTIGRHIKEIAFLSPNNIML